MNILQDGWSPQTKIVDVLEEIRKLLTTPDPDHALEAEIGVLYKTDVNKFNNNAKEWTKKYGKA